MHPAWSVLPTNVSPTTLSFRTLLCTYRVPMIQIPGQQAVFIYTQTRYICARCGRHSRHVIAHYGSNWFTLLFGHVCSPNKEWQVTDLGDTSLEACIFLFRFHTGTWGGALLQNLSPGTADPPVRATVHRYSPGVATPWPRARRI